MKAKLTPKQIAAILQISLATVSRMTASGLLPAILISVGRRKKIYRYDEDEIQVWIAERSRGGTVRKVTLRTAVRNGHMIATEKIIFAQGIETQSEKNKRTLA